MQFLDNALKTMLATYQGYFRGRFVEGLSISKYADVHQLNPSSVDDLQKKPFFAPVRLLKERDKEERICQLRKSTQD